MLFLGETNLKQKLTTKSRCINLTCYGCGTHLVRPQCTYCFPYYLENSINMWSTPQLILDCELKCIDASGLLPGRLTVGKVYRAMEISQSQRFVYVVQDNGQIRDFKTGRFEILPFSVSVAPNGFKRGDLVTVDGGSTSFRVVYPHDFSQQKRSAIGLASSGHTDEQAYKVVVLSKSLDSSSRHLGVYSVNRVTKVNPGSPVTQIQSVDALPEHLIGMSAFLRGFREGSGGVS